MFRLVIRSNPFLDCQLEFILAVHLVGDFQKTDPDLAFEQEAVASDSVSDWVRLVLQLT